MRTITSEFVVKGRWTQYPAKNPETNETAGYIPFGTSDDDNYDLLEAFVNLGLTMDALAMKVFKKKHYRVRVSAYIEE
jgi:hypothetical protein